MITASDITRWFCNASKYKPRENDVGMECFRVVDKTELTEAKTMMYQLLEEVETWKKVRADLMDRAVRYMARHNSTSHKGPPENSVDIIRDLVKLDSEPVQEEPKAKSIVLARVPKEITHGQINDWESHVADCELKGNLLTAVLKWGTEALHQLLRNVDKLKGDVRNKNNELQELVKKYVAHRDLAKSRTQEVNERDATIRRFDQRHTELLAEGRNAVTVVQEKLDKQIRSETTDQLERIDRDTKIVALAKKAGYIEPNINEALRNRAMTAIGWMAHTVENQSITIIKMLGKQEKRDTSDI